MDDATVKKWWINQHKNNYFKSFSFGFSYKNMARFNLANKSILEIGAGYGRETLMFCKLSPDVFACDISQETLDLLYLKLKDNGVNISFASYGVWDGIDLNLFPSWRKQFDFIYSCFVIQHMSKENAKKTISNCLKLLRPDGRIFFEFFGHPEFIGGGKDKDAFSGTPETGMYNNAFTEEEIIHLVEAAGGKIDFIEYWPIQEQGSKEMLKFNNYWVCIKQ